MKYKAVLTHNSQDYFEGIESEELVEELNFNDSTTECISTILKILDYVCSGYKAIILLREGDDSG